MIQSNSKLGRIRINALEVNCIIGILEHERQEEQALRIHIEYTCDFSKTKHHKNLIEAGIDYAELSQRTETFLKEQAFYLLEESIEQLGQYLFASYEQMTTLHLSIEKTQAIDQAQSVCASLSFQREPGH